MKMFLFMLVVLIQPLFSKGESNDLLLDFIDGQISVFLQSPLDDVLEALSSNQEELNALKGFRRELDQFNKDTDAVFLICLLYTSPSPRDA